MKYDTKTIEKACRLYQKKTPIRRILKETGIKSHSVVYFHCDPVKREEIVKRTKKWMKNNPERWREISRKAVDKFNKKNASRRNKK